MVNKVDFANRLQQMMNFYELSAASLADSIGIQRSSISHLLSGRNNPSLDFVLKILDNYPDIRFEWFVKGIGTLTSTSTSESINKVSPTLFEQGSTHLKTTNKSNDKSSFSFKKENETPKVLDKVLLLYTDGSFDIYKE